MENDGARNLGKIMGATSDPAKLRSSAFDLDASDVSDCPGKVTSWGSSHWVIPIRIIVTVALLYFVLRNVPFTEILRTLTESVRHWPFLIIALFLPILGGLVSAFRWKILLSVLRSNVSVVRLWEAILVGGFYNQFFPSTIGGDVVRSWWISNLPESNSPESLPSTSAVLNLTVVGMDRLSGIQGICGIAFLAAILNPSIVKKVPIILMILMLLTAVIIALAILPYLPIALNGKRLISTKPLQFFYDKASMVFETLRRYRRQKARLLSALLLSMGLQLLIILQYWALSNAFDLKLSIRILAVLVPIVNMISLVPITINGIGLRENALVVLGSKVGLSGIGAVALAWAFVAFTLVYAFIGGLIQLRGRRLGKSTWQRSHVRSVKDG